MPRLLGCPYAPAGMGGAMIRRSRFIINPVRARTRAHVPIQGMIP